MKSTDQAAAAGATARGPQRTPANTPCVELSLPQGDRATVALFGAQVLSWVTSDGVERMYLSPQALFDGLTPIRGGVPVCFPQFNVRGPLPKHGIARTLAWHAESSGDPSTVRLHLRDGDATRRWWPQAFDATLTVRLAPRRLRMTFDVCNTDTVAWEFSLALHSYLKVDAIEQTRLCGLHGLPYWDAVAGSESTEREDEIAFTKQFDRVYNHVPAGAVFELHQGGKPLRVTQSDSMTETVVWNPGADLSAALEDMPANGYRHMLCVEAAKVDQPVVLDPQQRWQGWQQFDVA